MEKLRSCEEEKAVEKAGKEQEKEEKDRLRGELKFATQSLALQHREEMQMMQMEHQEKILLLRHQLGGKEAEVLQMKSDGMYKDEHIRQLQNQLELTVAAAATHFQLLQPNNTTNVNNNSSSAPATGYKSSSSLPPPPPPPSLPSTAMDGVTGGAGGVNTGSGSGTGSGMVFIRPPSILTTPIPPGQYLLGQQPHPHLHPQPQPQLQPQPHPSMDIVSMQLTLAAHNVQLSTVGLHEARRERDEMEAKAQAHAQHITVLQAESAAKVINPLIALCIY